MNVNIEHPFTEPEVLPTVHIRRHIRYTKGDDLIILSLTDGVRNYRYSFPGFYRYLNPELRKEWISFMFNQLEQELVNVLLEGTPDEIIEV